VLQVAVVVPLALNNLSSQLSRQQDARIDQVMVAVDAEAERLRDDVRRTMDELAQSTGLEDVARDAAKVPAPPHVTRAATQLMTPRGLDVLALLDDEGRTLSSGHLPARLGEPDDPLFAVTRQPARSIIALIIELPGPDGLISAPAVVTARPIDYGDRRVWAVGGVLLTQARAQNLHRLTGARVEVWSQAALFTGAGTAAAPTSTRVFRVGQAAELRLAFSRADLLATVTEVRRAFLILAALGLLLSIGVGFVVSRRVTRPVEALTDAARKIAAGEPGIRVEAKAGTPELRALIDTFNRMTDDLKLATDKLVASERIAAWQEVARRLAHEIKNPLTPIRMSSETLLAASQRGTLDAKFHTLFRESAVAVLEEVERLKRIVDEFSQFARLPRPTLAPFNLSDAISQVMSLYADHGSLRYQRAIAPGVEVVGDRDQLTQVVVNLVKNAEEAMATTGGTLTVRLRPDATLEIEDEGPGIPPDLLGRLFEPYVTTKPQGTGLGLTIAQRIANEHNGRIEVQNRAEGGARFRLVLPQT